MPAAAALLDDPAANLTARGGGDEKKINQSENEVKRCGGRESERGTERVRERDRESERGGES